MSYRCDVSFKKINGLKQLEDFLCKLKKKIKEKDVIESILSDNFYYIPIENQTEIFKSTELRYWLTKCFTFRWCYIDYIDSYEIGYLAMYGIPKALQSEFDGTVYFQNSTDQNYDRTEWSGLEAFEQIYDSWFEVPPEEAYMYCYPGCEEDIENFIKSEDYDYVRKSATYKMIAEPIEKCLYDDNNNFISLLRENDDLSTIYTYLRQIGKLKDENKEFI